MTDTTTVSTTLAPTPAPSRLECLLERILPDPRMWVTCGLFVLAWKVLSMIEANPNLLANASFMVICSLIVGGGGLGLANTFFFGGTKSGSDVMANQSKAATQATPAPTDSTTTTTTTTGGKP